MSKNPFLWDDGTPSKVGPSSKSTNRVATAMRKMRQQRRDEPTLTPAKQPAKKDRK
jgi:hypothetical protein